MLAGSDNTMGSSFESIISNPGNTPVLESRYFRCSLKATLSAEIIVISESVASTVLVQVNQRALFQRKF